MNLEQNEEINWQCKQVFNQHIISETCLEGTLHWSLGLFPCVIWKSSIILSHSSLDGCQTVAMSNAMSISGLFAAFSLS